MRKETDVAGIADPITSDPERNARRSLELFLDSRIIAELLVFIHQFHSAGHQILCPAEKLTGNLPLFFCAFVHGGVTPPLLR